MIEVPSNGFTFKQICRIFNLRYIPVDDRYSFDWLHFDSEVLYLNIRLHKSAMTSLGNCMAITEIIPIEIIETIARNNDMWKSDKYQLSDTEFEAKKLSCNL